MRQPKQILIFPYRFNSNKEEYEYCIFYRRKRKVWQGIAGGVEDNETPLEAAIRELYEETMITDVDIYELSSFSTIPVLNVVGSYLWGNVIYVVTEYSFGANVENKDIILSNEHKDYKWVNYNDAIALLEWDSNKNALWELNERLLKNDLK